MTHGDKAKAKKAASQASGSKKTSSKAVQAGSKGGKNGKSAGKEGGEKKAEASPKAAEAPKKQQAVPKAVAVKSGSAKAGGSNGKPASRATAAAGEGGFSNPVIGNAFKRAVKKYPNAFRRLTD